MSTDIHRPARARSAEEKSQRRDHILRAAERLWSRTAYADLSMSQVAQEAQLAKGTLYLYFDTKEELFLALLGEHLHDWLESLAQRLIAAPPRTPEEVADVFADANRDHETSRRLLVLLTTVLEPGVRPEVTLAFKQNLMPVTRKVVEALPFAEEVGIRLLRHIYSLTIGWQLLTENTPATRHLEGAGPGNRADDFGIEFRLSVRAVCRSLAGGAAD